MNATSLLAHLRVAGVSISAEHGRLIVEGPTGVVTEELRAELLRCKEELIARLEESHSRGEEDLNLAEAQREISDLIAVAYRRYTAIQRVAQDRPPNSGGKELANPSGSSVHGGVP